tara:strand:+ start:66 stop:275 length:210 start_codon:yes stop_codon:yes gene_type:complete
MFPLSFEKRITSIVLNIIDKTLGKKFPIIDEITDVFQVQENKIKKLGSNIEDLTREIEALKSYLKDSLK